MCMIELYKFDILCVDSWHILYKYLNFRNKISITY